MTEKVNEVQNPSFVLQEPNKVNFEDRPVPEVKDPHDVIVQVKYTGICGSDVRSKQISPPLESRPIHPFSKLSSQRHSHLFPVQKGKLRMYLANPNPRSTTGPTA